MSRNDDQKCIDEAEKFIRDYRRMVRCTRQQAILGITSDAGYYVIRGGQLIAEKEGLRPSPARIGEET